MLLLIASPLLEAAQCNAYTFTFNCDPGDEGSVIWVRGYNTTSMNPAGGRLMADTGYDIYYVPSYAAIWFDTLMEAYCDPVTNNFVITQGYEYNDPWNCWERSALTDTKEVEWYHGLMGLAGIMCGGLVAWSFVQGYLG
jgi:hypothetical protein